MKRTTLLTICTTLLIARLAEAYTYNIVRDYSGSSFFDRWNFYDNRDNKTWGNVTYLSAASAASEQLAYVNSANNVIIKVDNTTDVPSGGERNSVRIESNDMYAVGSLWIIDLVHLPWGCSVWPGIWTYGPDGTLGWPYGGEIDIIEGINLMPNNQMALHTFPGCYKTNPPQQLGTPSTDADANDCSTAAGCIVTESKQNSYGSGFAENGGGVFAAQFDQSGIFIWFWPRSQVPATINSSTSTTGMNLYDWGNPSGAWPSTNCTTDIFFTPQIMVIDITLCGDWAGLPSVYESTCSSYGAKTGNCYNDCVLGNGSNYADAYFEIPYIRAYTLSGAPSATATAGSSSTSASGPKATSGAISSTSTRSTRPEWLLGLLGFSFALCFVL